MNEPKTMSYDVLLQLVEATKAYKEGQMTSEEPDLHERCFDLAAQLGTEAFGVPERGWNVFDITYALIGAFRLMPEDVTTEYVAKAVAELLGACGVKVEAANE